MRLKFSTFLILLLICALLGWFLEALNKPESRFREALDGALFPIDDLSGRAPFPTPTGNESSSWDSIPPPTDL